MKGSKTSAETAEARIREIENSLKLSIDSTLLADSLKRADTLQLYHKFFCENPARIMPQQRLYLFQRSLCLVRQCKKGVGIHYALRRFADWGRQNYWIFEKQTSRKIWWKRPRFGAGHSTYTIGLHSTDLFGYTSVVFCQWHDGTQSVAQQYGALAQV